MFKWIETEWADYLRRFEQSANEQTLSGRITYHASTNVQMNCNERMKPAHIMHIMMITLKLQHSHTK